MNIGSGPRLYTVTKDTKGNSTGEAKELPPPSEEKVGLCPPHHSRDHGKPKLLRVR